MNNDSLGAVVWHTANLILTLVAAAYMQWKGK